MVRDGMILEGSNNLYILWFMNGNIVDELGYFGFLLCWRDKVKV